MVVFDEKFQVLKAIIIFLAVDMVNNFLALKRAAKFFRHNQTVSQDIAVLVGHAVERMIWSKFNKYIALKVLFLAAFPTARGRTVMGAPSAKTRKAIFSRDVHRHLSCRATAILAAATNSYDSTISRVSLVVLLIVPVNDAAIRQHFLTSMLDRSSRRGATLTTDAVEANMNPTCTNDTLLTTQPAANGNIRTTILLKTLRPKNYTTISKLLILSYALASGHGLVLLRTTVG